MLTPIQKRVLKILLSTRNEHSYIAGGSALNIDFSRLSRDIDIFHDAQELCNLTAKADLQLLQKHGIAVVLKRQINGFTKAEAFDETGKTEIDWSWESSWRFFPAQVDDVLGYKLHPLDLATNKLLAMVGRKMPRDYYDVCTLIQNGFPIAECVWAMCSKDPGYTPYTTLDALSYASMHSQRDFDEAICVTRGTRPLTIQECKELFLDMRTKAQEVFATLPLSEFGVFYLRKDTGTAFFPTDADRLAENFVINPGARYGVLPEVPAEQENNTPMP
jgi:hypothetical protein